MPGLNKKLPWLEGRRGWGDLVNAAPRRLYAGGMGMEWTISSDSMRVC